MAGAAFGQPTGADPGWQAAMGQPRAGDADYQAAMGQPTAADPSFQQAMGQPHASPQTYGAPPAGYGMQPGGGMQAPLAKKGCCSCLGVLMLALGGGVIAALVALLV
jgi:hypothetical protein